MAPGRGPSPHRLLVADAAFALPELLHARDEDAARFNLQQPRAVQLQGPPRVPHLRNDAAVPSAAPVPPLVLARREAEMSHDGGLKAKLSRRQLDA